MPQHIRCGIFCFIRKSLFDSFEALLFDYSKLFSLAIYLPRISNSIFTTVPTSMLQKLVFSHVLRNDGYGEGVVGRLADGERNAVHSYAALIYGEVTLARHLLVQFIFEGEVG